MPVHQLSAARDLNSGLIAVRTDLNLIHAMRFSVVSTPVLRHQSAYGRNERSDHSVAMRWRPSHLPSWRLCRFALNLRFDTVEIVSHQWIVKE